MTGDTVMPRATEDQAGRLAGQEEFKEVTKKEEDRSKTQC
jgi:hypothetical protein